MKELRPKALSAANFAAFGDVIEARGTPRIINDGHAKRYHDLAALDLLAEGGRAIASIFRSTPPAYPFAIRTMERHPKSSQAFVPLSGRPFLVVVAPVGAFDETAIEAFVAMPTQGVNLRKGVWHHFNLALEAESAFLVIDRDAPDENTDEVQLAAPLVLHAPESSP
ncbi:ureidoglycolate hydrolase [alpha proteobacterium U9-1i]|nr:ureidoglycolate hydrolase [alpha proteobacterium U9-1i]